MMPASAEARIGEYRGFVAEKRVVAEETGYSVEASEVNPVLFPHQRDMVIWAVRGGRRAVFSSFGLGKTLVQLETIRLTLLKSGGDRGLIVLPLGVKAEFERDAKLIGLSPTFVRTTEEAIEAGPGIYLTNYESVREGKIDPTAFDTVSLDEADILRGFGGSKTARAFFGHFEDSAMPRYAATASPAPNDFEEILAYSEYLGIMDVGQAKTRFFRRDSEKADRLTIHPHKQEEFWHWVKSWAIFIVAPSDLGYSDDGYALPPLEVVWHEIPGGASEPRPRGDGQFRLMADASLGVVDASREKRASLPARVAKALEIRASEPDEHRVIWHDLEDERKALESAMPGIATVFGAQKLEDRESITRAFSDGETAELGAKPVMLGSGVNLQKHCARAIYLGIGFKFKDFIQSVHRLQRFGQTRAVRIDLIHTEAERGVKEDLLRKWRQHEEMQNRMRQIVREFGLSHSAIGGGLGRSMGVEPSEASGNGEAERSHLSYRLIHNDSVEAAAQMEDGCVDLIVTSIPFSSQYEYSPSYNDFGHTDDNDHFWEQMGFLSRELIRILAPGRVCAIHVKDRITPGGINGLGFQTLTPFSDECVQHFRDAGFAFIARKTIVTDVVRENAQTYRLGWTEQCKDGSRMGAGVPEYLLIFRKPPSDPSNGYADVPVVKSKEAYTRGRWQADAAGFERVSGDRFLARCDLPHGEALKGMTFKDVYRRVRFAMLNGVYDFEDHVRLCDELDRRMMLPTGFALVPAHSWHPEVWSDVARMRTLNMDQAAKGREMHLCPLQFDIVDRAIAQYSMPGEVVYDPFSGLGTVPIRALKLHRCGWGSELSGDYWGQSTLLMRAELSHMAVPSLFDAIELEEEDVHDPSMEAA